MGQERCGWLARNVALARTAIRRGCRSRRAVAQSTVGRPVASAGVATRLGVLGSRFFDPIILPGRKQPLRTLRDAAQYITKLPKAEHDADEWQAAMEALLLVAEHDGPPMFARIGVLRALNRHVERVFDPSRKETHWGRRKLARDR